MRRAGERLRFDEAFALQLTMAHRRADAATHGAVPRPPQAGGLLDAFDARLPFTLTAGQVEVSEEIMAELARTHPMQRLLQGEVGSGKTLVASAGDAGGGRRRWPGGPAGTDRGARRPALPHHHHAARRPGPGRHARRRRSTPPASSC